MRRYNRSSYSKDPFWLTAKFGNCKECKTELKGKRAFYYPLSKECYCETCGNKHSADFELNRQDEDFVNSQFSY